MNPAGWPKVTVAVIAAAVAVSLAGCAASLWVATTDGQSIATATFNAAVILAFAVVGAVIAAARPDNTIGWLMLGGGVFWSAGGAAVDLAHHGIVASPGTVPDATALAIGGSAARSIGWYLITIAVPVLFPNGHVASRRWRWLTRAVIVIVVGAVLDPLTDPKADLTNFGSWHNPIAPTGAWRAISGIAFLAHVPLSLVVTVAAVVQLGYRWRHGNAFQRQQLTLFAGAVAMTIIAVPIAFGFGAGSWIFGAAALPLPFAIGFAVLARGLYDLRAAANRTLVWVTLSAVVAGAYALVIAGIGGLLHVDRHAAWLAWTAAVVVAVSFAPLRDSLQRAINRLTFGRWDEPYAVLAALGQRVEGTADADRLLADVVTELTSLGLRDIAILDVNGNVVAGVANTDDPVEMPLSAYGAVVGSLQYQPPATPLRQRDHQLLDDLAGHLGGVLHAHQLTAELQRARERLVLAREEERRRLRRDLHDGLGPALAGHLLRLDIAAGKVGRDSPAAADIDALRDDLRATVAEVRRVVEGLRPPALDELGLTGAIEQITQRLVAGTPTTVTVDANGLPPLSAAVEVAAFRIVTEAVTNVVRHASAPSCVIAIAADHNLLRISVTDNGSGLAATLGPAGHGLQTMRERAEELRGRFRVISKSKGTTVFAELPMPRTQAEASASAVRARAR